MNNEKIIDNYAQALYDYEANYPDELTIKSGDIVQILCIKKDDPNWLHAKSLMQQNGLEGLIPRNYVKCLSESKKLFSKNESDIYVAIADFDIIEQNDLELRKNDLLVSIKQIDQNWLYGYKLMNEIQMGMFPLNSVKKVYIDHENKLMWIPKQAKVLYDFTDDEYQLNDRDLTHTHKYLKLNKNDYVLITDKLNDDWFVGENFSTNESGIFPKSFVDILQEGEEEEEEETNVNNKMYRSNSILNRTQHNFLEQINLSIINNINNNKNDDEEIIKYEPKYCKLLYDFNAESENELSAHFGEYLKIIDHNEDYNNEWIKCVNNLNKQGIVPLNYVEIINNQIETKTIDDIFHTQKFQPPESNNNNNFCDLNSLNSFDFEETIEDNNFIYPNLEEEQKNSFNINSNLNNQRNFIIEELIDTEKDYLNEMKLVYKVFCLDEHTSPSSSEFNKKLLFDKLKQIVEISENFLKSYEKNAQIELNNDDNNDDHVKIGLCLIELANEIKTKNIYAQYARSHNDVSILVKKYESNQNTQEYIFSRLSQIKDKLRVASLSSLLIKPVQRIFKYPLFINRLLSNTNEKNVDYSNLKQASNLFVQLLDYINEYKRRKDLVTKYLGPSSSLTNSQINANDESYLTNGESTTGGGGGVDTLSEMMKKINMRTLKKKSTRISLQISSALGLFAPHVNDEQFNKLEANFRLIEKQSKSIYNDLDHYLTSLKNLLDCEKNLFDNLLDIDSDTFSRLNQFMNTLRSNEFQKFILNNIKPNVLEPMGLLINVLFQGPNKLIEKRYDKLLDHEGALSDLELKKSNNIGPNYKEILSHCEQTKKDYEALNMQLKEDLPILNQRATKILKKCVEYFLNKNYEFLQMINIGFHDIIFNCKFNHTRLSEMEQANLIIKLNNLNFPYTNRQTTNNNLNSNSNNSSSSSLISVLNNSNSSNLDSVIGLNRVSYINEKSSGGSVRIQSFKFGQIEEHRQKLMKHYPSEKLYVVKNNYVANEKLCQLQQSVNDLVGLIKSHDPSNQKNIWFVDNGHEKGFIPSQALEPFKNDERNDADDDLANTNKNLIDFNDTTLNGSNNCNSRPPSYDLNMLLNDRNDMIVVNEQYCIAVYDFKSIASNMIDLIDGEIYKVIEKCDKKNDPEWWLLENKNNIRGYVPRNYVKLLD